MDFISLIETLQPQNEAEAAAMQDCIAKELEEEEDC